MKKCCYCNKMCRKYLIESRLYDNASSHVCKKCIKKYLKEMLIEKKEMWEEYTVLLEQIKVFEEYLR